jgi:hemerythrin-like domain-containing protein
MTERKKTRRTKAPADAIALLTQDHRSVQKMFKEFEKQHETLDEATKAEIVRVACQELTIHAQIEEELFYPALREALGEEGKDLLDEAQVEHDSAKQLIGELERMGPGEELFDAKFTVLGEYVNHHIKEENGEIFKEAKKTGVDLVALGEQMLRRKEELQAGMTQESAEA